MSLQPPIPGPLWDTVPPDAQAALLAAFDALRQQVDQLERRVRDLEARLQLNSTDSSKPPSSDPIGLKRKPPKPPGRRKRGGQPGHRQATRALVPPERLRSSTDCKPDACRRCGGALHGDDPIPLIQQVAELPRIEPIVDEYRLHRLPCPRCGVTTCATPPEGVPAGSFGPYLQAVLATWAGAYRLSERQIQQMAGDLFGLSISAGMISKLERRSAEALEAPYHELAAAVHSAGVIHADETSWRQERRKTWLWVAVTAMITVFTIARNRSAQGRPGGAGDARRGDRGDGSLRLLRLDRRDPPPGVLEPHHPNAIDKSGGGPASPSGPPPSPSPGRAGSSGPGPDGSPPARPSGMTWRISSESSPTMTRSISNCKIRCRSANVASSSRDRTRRQNASGPTRPPSPPGARTARSLLLVALRRPGPGGGPGSVRGGPSTRPGRSTSAW